jgi:hypothetical protein
MPQEGVTYQEEILVFTWQSALVDDKVAFALVALVKILFWVDFENVIAHLKTYGLDLGRNFFAWLLNVAESLV